MKSELEKKFDEGAKKVIYDFGMILYNMEPSEDAYHDLREIAHYLQWTILHSIESETIDSLVKKLHECTNELIERFKAISDFMEDFYEENKDNTVATIGNIGRWSRSIWLDVYTRVNIMAEFMKSRMETSGKKIE